jgi:hypothetical protein
VLGKRAGSVHWLARHAILSSNITIPINPALGRQSLRQFQLLVGSFAEALSSAPATDQGVGRVVVFFRARLRQLSRCPSNETVKLLLTLHVIADLVVQGWLLRVAESTVTLTYTLGNDDAHGRSKEAVRKSHLVERDSQLSEPSVEEFIRGMEKRRLTAKGWHSIYSLMRDGKELAGGLRTVAAIQDVRERLERLGHAIAPYLQFITAGAVCEHTGLPLSDIWRYFRHTWTTAYRSVPGRSIMILVRDAASPNHPVIGIAALGSAVMQQSVRDRWLGWDAQSGVTTLLAKPSTRAVTWLWRELRQRIQDIYVKDLIQSGIIIRNELTEPTETTIAHLGEEAERAIHRHRQHPQKTLHKRFSKVGNPSGAEWERRARSHLFRAKRAKALATLLGIHRVFADHFAGVRKIALVEAFKSTKVRTAVAQLVRVTKAERVGICIMDVTVCGALAPYNALLGGKLVSILLCSPEVTRYYAKRYGQQQSLIASSMKGTRVIRKPCLVFLGTTSLYGIGASQYNRIKIPAGEVGGRPGTTIEYKALGYSVGYGSFHFSNETVSMIETLLARTKNGRKVNSIFGEGVNPLMRKIREGLDLIGLPSDQLLLHGNRRIVYGVSLAANFREILLGLQQRPQYLMTQDQPQQGTARIAAYWKRRWLDTRITRPEILEAVSQHTLAYPITHGAQVRLPSDNNRRLFDDGEGS